MTAVDKHATVLDFDRVLGLDLRAVDRPEELPAEVGRLVEARTKARLAKNWAESDRLRDEIQAQRLHGQGHPRRHEAHSQLKHRPAAP